MTLINRTSLNDWNEYLNADTEVSDTKFINIELPNGPYDTLDTAKAEIADLISIYDHVKDSDLNESNVFELSPNKNSLVLKTTRKSLKNGHRPLAEAGAPLNTLNVEFNIFKYQNQIRENDKCSWTQGIKKFDDLVSYNEIKTVRAKEAVDKGFSTNADELFDVTDKLFALLGSANDESNFENSFLAIKKNISDPPTENVVHFMNHCNMTFVFQTTESEIDSYVNYLNAIFSTESQVDDWHEDLKTHFLKPGNTKIENHPDNPYDYSWHCREPYHIVDNYYGITISKNSMCSNSHRIMNDLIVNYEKLPFDWENYPGNLYIGNVCKILKD